MDDEIRYKVTRKWLFWESGTTVYLSGSNGDSYVQGENAKLIRK
jgi:hypothetical protein